MSATSTLKQNVTAFVRWLQLASPKRAALPAPVPVILPADVAATLGHELRTPLGALLGYAELLSAPGPMDEATRRAYAAAALSAVKHLDELIKAVVDDDAPGLAAPGLVRDVVDLTALVSECCELVRLEAQRAGVALAAPGAAPAVEARCDARAIRQIVLNLLGNAIKFTPAGGAVRAHATCDGDRAVLVITENGVGMSVAASQDDGRGDTQGRATPGRGTPGRGLGLSLARSLARLQGGELAIRPADGGGTEVRVMLPRRLPSADAAPSTQSHSSAAASAHPSQPLLRMAPSCA